MSKTYDIAITDYTATGNHRGKTCCREIGQSLKTMKHFLCALWILLTLQCCAQKGKTTHLEKAQTSLSNHAGGPYTHYAIVSDGKIIERADISEHGGATPYKIFPHAVKIGQREYKGILYLNTAAYKVPFMQYTDDMKSDEPLHIEPDCLCYITDFDTTGKTIAHATELKPQPLEGETAYLKNLSHMIDTSTEPPSPSTVQDSVSVQFVVTKTGMLTMLETVAAQKPEQEAILQAIKRHSCTWSLAMNSGRPLLFRRKMKIFYTRDKKGNIQSLNQLTYQ